MGAQQSTGKITKKNKIVELYDQEITNFPPIPKDNQLQTLSITSCKIAELPIPLPKLLNLTVSHTLDEVIPQEFQNSILSYTKLEHLNLTGNNLKEFPQFINQIKDLKTLNLFYNQISELDLSLKTIETLNIGHNKFISMPQLPTTLVSLTFSYNLLKTLDFSLPKLTYLSLELIGLNSITKSLVFPKLKTLNLSKNILMSVPDLKTLCPVIETLNLSDNLLQYFPPPPSTIKVYNVSSNQITEIPDIIADLHNLTLLDVSKNNLTYIPQLSDTIEDFIFSHNHVTKVKPSFTPNLKRLWFRNNELTEYPKYESAKVKDAGFSHNCISKIDVNILNPNVIRVEGPYNSITTIPSNLFKLAHLSSLLLQNNEITTVPSSIINSRILSILNLSNNPIEELPQLPETLQQLYVVNCKLKSLGNCLRNCGQLSTLVASCNELSELPHLPSLKILNIARNKFSVFPSKLSTKLTIFDISLNNINVMPDYFVFPEMDELDLSHNPIMNFPSTFTCPKLRFLRLNSTMINETLNPKLFKGIEILDILNSGIVFRTEPEMRQLFVDHRLPQYKSKHVKEVSCYQWLGFSETIGTREEMEDAIAIKALIQKDIDIYCVFDGHGGNSTSAYASMFIQDAYRIAAAKFTKKFFYLIMRKLDKIIHNRKFTDGTTVAACIFNGKKIISGHLGDSRILVISNDGKVKYATKDHKATSREEFERIHMEGGRVEDMRTHGILALGRSIGDKNVPGTSSIPEIHEYVIHPDDKWIIVACDGVFDVLSNEFIGQYASHAQNATELAADIRNLAYANLSSDNITVIAVDIQERRKFVEDKLGLSLDELSYISNPDLKMEDETDDDTLSIEPMHISFDLNDVDPSLYMSSIANTESSWSFMSQVPSEQFETSPLAPPVTFDIDDIHLAATKFDQDENQLIVENISIDNNQNE